MHQYQTSVDEIKDLHRRFIACHIMAAYPDHRISGFLGPGYVDIGRQYPTAGTYSFCKPSGNRGAARPNFPASPSRPDS